MSRCGGRESGRWETNQASPSKYGSPQRQDRAELDPDRDELVWSRWNSGLSDRQIDTYLQCTSHLPRDVALMILHKNEYNIAVSIEACERVEMPEALSPLEKKVLLAAAPFPENKAFGVKHGSELHVYSLLPHIRPEVIRNYYNHCGRDSFAFPRGWTPRVAALTTPAFHGLVSRGFINIDDDSPLYERPEKRVTRSQLTISNTPKPHKMGKRNDLHIAMVGYDQPKTIKVDDDYDVVSHTSRRSVRHPPISPSIMAPKRPSIASLFHPPPRPPSSSSSGTHFRIPSPERNVNGVSVPVKTPSSNNTSPNTCAARAMIDIIMNSTPPSLPSDESRHSPVERIRTLSSSSLSPDFERIHGSNESKKRRTHGLDIAMVGWNVSSGDRGQRLRERDRRSMSHRYSPSPPPISPVKRQQRETSYSPRKMPTKGYVVSTTPFQRESSVASSISSVKILRGSKERRPSVSPPFLIEKKEDNKRNDNRRLSLPYIIGGNSGKKYSGSKLGIDMVGWGDINMEEGRRSLRSRDSTPLSNFGSQASSRANSPVYKNPPRRSFSSNGWHHEEDDDRDKKGKGSNLLIDMQGWADHNEDVSLDTEGFKIPSIPIWRSPGRDCPIKSASVKQRGVSSKY